MSAKTAHAFARQHGRKRFVEKWCCLGLAIFFIVLLARAGRLYAAIDPRTVPNSAQGQTSTLLGADLYGTDKISEQTRLPPTKVSLMPYRHLELEYSLAGYRRSQVPLVAFDGDHYFKAGFGDDPGIYYFIPQVASWTGMSLERSIDLFWGSILIISFSVGIAGLLVYLKSGPVKLWAGFGLCLLLWFSFRKGDLYIALSAPAIAVVPWFLYLLKKNATNALAGGFLFATGLLAGFANETRGQAATALLIFIVILLVFERTRSSLQKLALLAALFAGLATALVPFEALLARRDKFLSAEQPGYTETIDHHSIWHSAYIGLGFVPNNPYVAGYRDEVAVQAVYAISPATRPLSPEYDRILRNETLRLATQHPGFILLTLLEKLRIILFLMICWGNVGLFAAAFYPKSPALESAFWAALTFTSLFGMIAIPQVQYLLGFIAFATLYGLVSLDWALEQKQLGGAGSF